MKKRLLLNIFLGLACFVPMWMAAQQLPISNRYTFNPSLMNPANVGAVELNNVFVSHQQRRMAIAGWRSISQFVNFSSQPLGRKGAFGWGGILSNDIEHTEHRIGVSLAIAAHPVRTKTSRLSLGVSGGLINLNSNYNKARYLESGDRLLDNPSSFIELDAGMGAEFAVRSDRVRMDLSAAGTQLPGNAVSGSIPGFRLRPHLLAGGRILLSPVHNLYIGPTGFYRNLLDQQYDLTFDSDGDAIADSTISVATVRQQRARLEIGLMGELDRQGMWGGISYRLDRSNLTVAAGLRIMEPDTAGESDKVTFFADMHASFSMPTGPTSFGPDMEIGLIIHFGRYRRIGIKNITSTLVEGSFWINEGNINRHLENRLAATAPEGLRAQTNPSDTKVDLTYDFNDDSYLYCGSSPTPVMDTLLEEIGAEWLGVDAFLENVADEIVQEALHPDSSGVLNPEVLEPLTDLVSIELSCMLQVDEIDADAYAEGKMYEGELGVNNIEGDSLMIKVVYNDSDTLIEIGKDRQITNLELACLKLHSMRKKLEFEMKQTFGEDFAFLWEGEKATSENTQGKKIVRIKKLRITPNNPNQPAFQVNRVKLRFTRGQAKEIKTGDGNSDIVDVDTGKRKKRNRRGQKNRDRVK